MPVTFPGCYEDTSFYPNFLRGYNDVYYNVHSGSPVRFCFFFFLEKRNSVSRIDMRFVSPETKTC